MRILITGGTGALGRRLVEAAERAGHAVRIASRRPPSPGERREWARMAMATGEGVPEAVAGVEAVVHAASDPRRPAADVEGARRLVEAARAAGVRHLVYVSIVGIDRIPFGYYRAKLRAEEVVEQGGVPFSTLRATQFHGFVDRLLAAAARVPLVLPLPAGFRVQSVDAGEVAERLVRAVEAEPGGRLRDFGGPEVLELSDAAGQWKRYRGVGKPLLPLPVPGALAAAFRAGRNTAPEGDRGRVTWQDWLAGRGA